MIDKAQTVVERYRELGRQMADPAIAADQNRVVGIAKEHRRLEPLARQCQNYLKLCKQIEEDKQVLSGTDAELKDLVKEELPELEDRRVQLEDKLKMLMLPRDPNDDRNTIVEIRAGTGGDEAALFAADLYRMYLRYSERRRWKTDVLELNETGIGGFKAITFSVEGEGAFGRLKYESGVHRVQRVPKTEAGGRLHTSAATVAVLPEAEEADITVIDSDLKIDTYRASGHGGQHVNKTDSAIRITHLPSGLVVTCQDESSQHKNRAAAMKVLRARLLSMEQERLSRERAETRKSLVSTGDRSAKIRTYNFPQSRVTDHRINFTSHRLEAILDGDLEEMIEHLRLAEQQAQLQG
ncbi:MAG: peptide chain release factor 1 [FCB group bacterium]|nr:peptide chain release factor 1 [FCB group bacterium]